MLRAASKNTVAMQRLSSSFLLRPSSVLRTTACSGSFVTPSSSVLPSRQLFLQPQVLARFSTNATPAAAATPAEPVTPPTPSQSQQTSAEPQSQTPKKKQSRGVFRKLAKVLGASALLFTAYGVYLLKDEEERSWQLLMWKTLPLRFMSYVWGSIHRIELPESLRRPLYMAWTRAFDCQLHEIAGGGEATLNSFPNLNAFFIRRLDLVKFRPLAKEDMISPVDGRVNVFGEVTPDGYVEQIKGMKYRVDDLLGFPLPPMKKDSKMYYYVLYLAPGDYHRMHSPADCTIAERRHFPGALYPVLPSIAQYIPSLFVRNERVVLSGAWKHGFFAMVLVGAYNVGSMKLTFDEGLDTNLREHTFTQYRPNLDDGLKSKPYFKDYRSTTKTELVMNRSEVGTSIQHFSETDQASRSQSKSSWFGFGRKSSNHAKNEVGQQIATVDRDGVHLNKGDEFSRFELGSTIVVFFEMDKSKKFNWNIEPNQKVKLGQKLGVILK